jgi:hypothetical protein
MIIEAGTRKDFKQCVLDNVTAWTYTCEHVRVLDLKTMDEHGGRAVDFGMCEECKDEHFYKLQRVILEKYCVDRGRRRDGIQALLAVGATRRPVRAVQPAYHFPGAQLD